MLYTIGWIIIGFCIGYLCTLLRYQSILVKHRRSAIRSSQSIIMWHVHEKIAPLLPHFPYHPKDMVFIGKGIDYLVFEWLHTGICSNIVLLEIKSGSSTLNRNEQSIKKAVEDKRISYNIWKA